MASAGFKNLEDCPQLIARETEMFSAYFAKLIREFAYSDYRLDMFCICLSGQHEMTEDFTGFRNFFTLNFIAKPIYNAYILASHLGTALLGAKVENENIHTMATKKENDDLAVLLSYSSEHFAEDIPEIEETLCFEESIEKKTVTVYCIDREHTNPYRLYQRLGIKNSPSEEELRLLREEGKIKPLYKQSGKEPIKLKLTANCTYLILAESCMAKSNS